MDWITAIQQMAFPIVACCAMGWYVVRQDDKHEKEMETMRTAIENNTIALTKLVERMDDNE